MSSSEKTARIAASYYRRYHNEVERLRQDGTIGDMIICTCSICRMVDGISEQTDLERLREWLKLQLADYEIRDRADERGAIGKIRLLERIIGYIGENAVI